jgi:hypothetical protein
MAIETFQARHEGEKQGLGSDGDFCTPMKTVEIRETAVL